ncbi:DOMON-like domain-containing protein [Cyanobium sp. LEGE 06113]|uniref:DOMON-like domain-containing protein n=1 Tax=Cyanobium sp. LEGE 06113 TaxID=1297573 RepID=UPI0018807173|nr:DOMON-like domain-containing protein [Cyanobium sp. LEGE 06113]MBE9154952.1 DOMON-like domain-containing protein [Cyanobium sp. LEGE 06113]
MARHPFELVPFPDPTPTDSTASGPTTALTNPKLTIQGQLSLDPREQGGPALELLIELTAPAGHPGLEALLIPEAQATPGAPRRDGLWEHTCLECFVAPAGQPSYLEFNLCPDGAWNVYALEGYRQGLKPAAGFDALPFDCQRSASALSLSLRCQLPEAWATATAFDWQVSAVLEQRGGLLSYWALRHPAGAADFHARPQWTQASPL